MQLRFVSLVLFLVYPLSAEEVEPFELFERHCIKCHGQSGKVKGKVNLLELENLADLKAKPSLIEELVGVLEDREMPPEGELQLAEKDRLQLIVQLRTVLRDVAQKEAFLPTPMRRICLLYTSPSPRDGLLSRMPSSA